MVPLFIFRTLSPHLLSCLGSRTPGAKDTPFLCSARGVKEAGRHLPQEYLAKSFREAGCRGTSSYGIQGEQQRQKRVLKGGGSSMSLLWPRAPPAAGKEKLRSVPAGPYPLHHHDSPRRPEQELCRRSQPRLERLRPRHRPCRPPASAAATCASSSARSAPSATATLASAPYMSAPPPSEKSGQARVHFVDGLGISL